MADARLGLQCASLQIMALSPDQWEAVDRLYHAALARPVDARAAFLAEACAGDEALRREVESLLAQSAAGVLTGGAVVAAAELVTDAGGSVLTGRRLGAYHILAPIGAGGMGEVYRARDTRLGREVAIKILPRVFTADADRLARFEREARVLASLNHPHIATIHGIEEAPIDAGAPVRALILELVNGETLAERIASVGSKGLPITEALGLAHQIADGLDAAHEKGIVHRDLKPANIKITPDGIVKVLDFGLAKAATGDGSTPDLTQSPTVTVGGTRNGIILGTAAYMSPEQARGQAADKRTDIWAFGCVLYEMLTAKRGFEGATLSDTIVAILEREPDWSALPETTPAGIRRLLRRCLEKQPKRRLHDIADAGIELEEALVVPSRTESLERQPRSHPAWRPAVFIVAAAVAIGGMVGWNLRLGLSRDARTSSGSSVGEVRLEITTPPTTDPASLAISPDGLSVAFVATAEGRPRLWIRALDSTSARPLPGTDGATLPFWSPDSGSVGFFATGQLKRIDIQTGTVQAVASADAARGASWNRDGVILFQSRGGPWLPLLRVPAIGGGTAVVNPDHGGRFPQFLPDGRHFIYSGPGASDSSRGIYLGELDGSAPRRLLDANSAAVYASSGHLLFVRQGTLMAQALDAPTLTVVSDPVSVASGISVIEPLGLAPLSASAAGPVVYRTGSAGGVRQFSWFDRAGRLLSNVGDPAGYLLSPSMSPDGGRVAVHRSVDANSDIWLLDIRRGVLSRFTSDPVNEYVPIWSPDGSRLIFQAGGNLRQRSVTGVGPEEIVLQTPQTKLPTDWSRDGRFVLYSTYEPKPDSDIWALPMEHERKPFPVAQSRFNEDEGQFSPDGKWIAYRSDESGRAEIYVRPFPGSGAPLQVSTNGGAQVRWRHDGRELFYIALDDRLMAVPLRSSGPDKIDAGAPVPIFLTHVGGALSIFMSQYMVSDDGQRFLMNTVAEEVASPITVVLNWRAKR